MRLLPLLTLSLACTPKDDTGVTDTGGAEDSGQAGALSPEWDLAAAEAALGEALTIGLPEPITVNDWFYPLIKREATEQWGCYSLTGSEEEGWVSEWEGDCTTPSGYRFVGGWLYRDEVNITESGAQRDMRLLASFHIENPDGTTTTGGGEMTLVSQTGLPDLYQLDIEMGGIYEVPGQTGWLADGIGAGFSLDSQRDVEGQVTTLAGGLTHNGIGTLYFEDVTLTADCGAVPMGQIRLRDPSSLWYDFDFGEACDGCAAVSLQGEDLGESCIGEEVAASIQATLSKALP